MHCITVCITVLDQSLQIYRMTAEAKICRNNLGISRMSRTVCARPDGIIFFIPSASALFAIKTAYELTRSSDRSTSARAFGEMP